MIRSRPVYSSSRSTNTDTTRRYSPGNRAAAGRPPRDGARGASATRGGARGAVGVGRAREVERERSTGSGVRRGLRPDGVAPGHAAPSDSNRTYPGGSGPAGEAQGFRARISGFYRAHEKPLLLAAGVVAALVSVFLYGLLAPEPPRITEADVETAILETLDSLPEEPSLASRAYEIIRPSVVRVRRLSADTADDSELGVGTGVVIVNTGVILTSLHVVAGAERVTVVFADGFETEATVVTAQPENDLAVLQAEVIPEGLVPAILASSASLRVGDEVVAVGTPFGIGNSASAGVVSGLGRSYTSENGDALLSNLIQFDAAANPGNSGGPLVNRRGEVVGIVTAIYNPTNLRVFIGIGFAVPIDTAAAAAGPSPF